MQTPVNTFKQALRDKRPQIGLWLGLADYYGTEICAGKAAGILTTDDDLARHYLQLGATFVAVGLDNNLLARVTSQLAAKFKTGAAAAPAGKTH